MLRKKHRPPPESESSYTEPNNCYAAILINGIAAFFYSTGFYVFIHIMAYIAGKFNLHFPVFVWESVFLSIRVPKKPRRDRPRCRSPPVLHFRQSPEFTKMEDCYMAEIKNPDAYFATMVRNSYKDEFRANDNFFKHVSSVGDEDDIQQQSKERNKPMESDAYSVEQQLCEISIQNWLLFMENQRLHNILSQFPPKDVELLFLIFSARLRQADIARLYNVSQGMVAYRYKKLKIKILGFLQKP